MSEVAELTAALIAARSPNPPGDERAAAAVAAEALPVAPRTIARVPERPNLLATLDFGPGGRHLVLCGHLDTKPVGGASSGGPSASATTARAAATPALAGPAARLEWPCSPRPTARKRAIPRLTSGSRSKSAASPQGSPITIASASSSPATCRAP